MATFPKYPKIKSVVPQSDRMLLVTFVDGTRKIYDCNPLLQHDAFHLLHNPSFFRCVHPDPHGYGVIWNDDLDLAESEIWINGRIVD